LKNLGSIEKLASVPESERAGKTIAEIYREAQGVAPFVPVMILSKRRGLEMRVIGRQIAFDHDKYLLISMAIVDAL